MRSGDASRNRRPGQLGSIRQRLARKDVVGHQDTALLELVQERRSQASRPEAADHYPLGRYALDLERKELLESDHVRLHPLYLRDRSHAARAVLESLEMD